MATDWKTFLSNARIPDESIDVYSSALNDSGIAIEDFAWITKDDLEKIIGNVNFVHVGWILHEGKNRIEEKEKNASISNEAKDASHIGVKLAYYGWKEPETLLQAMTIIGFLLAKLELDEGILASVFARSILEKFKKQYLMSYIPAKSIKTAETLRLAYQKFYNDQTPASTTVKNKLKMSASEFTNHCLNLYKTASELIHSVADQYKVSRSVEELRKILRSVPQQSEEERACIEAIRSLPNPSVGAQWGPVNQAYFDEMP